MNSADEAQVKGKKRKAELQREQEGRDLATLMDTVEGRRFVWRLLDLAGIYRSSFDVEPLQMAFREGARNSGLLLVADIHEFCADKFHIMTTEAKHMEARYE